MSDELDLRVSDEQRERVAVALREHCAAGRLTLEELSERLDEAYRARTAGERLPPPCEPLRSLRGAIELLPKSHRASLD